MAGQQQADLLRKIITDSMESFSQKILNQLTTTHNTITLDMRQLSDQLSTLQASMANQIKKPSRAEKPKEGAIPTATIGGTIAVSRPQTLTAYFKTKWEDTVGGDTFRAKYTDPTGHKEILNMDAYKAKVKESAKTKYMAEQMLKFLKNADGPMYTALSQEYKEYKDSFSAQKIPQQEQLDTASPTQDRKE